MRDYESRIEARFERIVCAVRQGQFNVDVCLEILIALDCGNEILLPYAAKCLHPKPPARPLCCLSYRWIHRR